MQAFSIGQTRISVEFKLVLQDPGLSLRNSKSIPSSLSSTPSTILSHLPSADRKVPLGQMQSSTDIELLFLVVDPGITVLQTLQVSIPSQSLNRPTSQTSQETPINIVPLGQVHLDKSEAGL